MKNCLSRFGALIHFVLSGFDRLRFVGESRLLNSARDVDRYLHHNTSATRISHAMPKD